ncbi:unnamed protein product [Didymodactylos carnosus]|uniref:Uncharacterized protein n=1 Tax=Didymodactylos carnosus TaxID=1234261 RepID=A0A814SEC8_9BILA|nr:unnamed protein product [Didymodactylos carnosus]CAF3909857.1 unnamed protein product [Didymodactylos carnosus]
MAVCLNAKEKKYITAIGKVTWSPTDPLNTGNPINVTIIQTYAWTDPLVQCTDAMIASKSPIGPVGGFYPGLAAAGSLVCINNCGSTTGQSKGYDNSAGIPIMPDCTDSNPELGNVIGQRQDVVTLYMNDVFTVAYQGSAWITLGTGSGASWSIASKINLQLRPDGYYNTAPIGATISPINVVQGQTQTIDVPISDANNDILKCRWASQSNGECGSTSACPPGSLPSVTTLIAPCSVQITTTSSVGTYFALSLMVEDYYDNSSTTPMSAVPIQFLVKVVDTTACARPEVIGVPGKLSCLPIQVGTPFITQIIAINYCPTTTNITEISTLSIPGMNKSALIRNDSSTYYRTLTWIPTYDQVGPQVVCAVAVDTLSAQSDQYCFLFFVSYGELCGCPGSGITCPSTTSTSSTSTTETTST